MNYNEYIKSNEWKEKKRTRLEKDNYVCQDCKKSSIALDVHHITYDRLGNEDIFDIVSLCRHCHESLHRRNGDSAALNKLDNEQFTTIDKSKCEYIENLNCSVSSYNGYDFDMEQNIAAAKTIRSQLHPNIYFAVHNHKGGIFVYPKKAFEILLKRESIENIEKLGANLGSEVIRVSSNKGEI